MDGMVGADWPARYRDLCSRLPGIVARSRLTLCGMSACVDARIADARHGATARSPRSLRRPRPSRRSCKDRAARSVGGEVRLDWDDGPAWLRAHVPVRFALGGTGPHAAWVLSTLGAPTAVALEDRSARMLACLPDTLMIAEDSVLRHGRDATARGEARPEIFIFEYTAGSPGRRRRADPVVAHHRAVQRSRARTRSRLRSPEPGTRRHGRGRPRGRVPMRAARELDGESRTGRGAGAGLAGSRTRDRSLRTRRLRQLVGLRRRARSAQRAPSRRSA